MGVTFIAVVMILAIVAIAIVIYKSIADKEEPAAEETDSGKLHIGGGSPPVAVEENPKSPGTLHPPKPPEKPWKKDTGINHNLERIYVCVYPTGIWVCPDCECENDFGRRTCCVCNKQR